MICRKHPSKVSEEINKVYRCQESSSRASSGSLCATPDAPSLPAFFSPRTHRRHHRRRLLPPAPPNWKATVNRVRLWTRTTEGTKVWHMAWSDAGLSLTCYMMCPSLTVGGELTAHAFTYMLPSVLQSILVVYRVQTSYLACWKWVIESFLFFHANCYWYSTYL